MNRYFDPQSEPIPYPESTMPDAKPDLKPAAAQPEASPTGLPLIPPKLVPYAYAAWLFLGGGGLALLPDGKPTQIGSLVVLALGILLGVASPGARRK